MGLSVFGKLMIRFFLFFDVILEIVLFEVWFLEKKEVGILLGMV